MRVNTWWRHLLVGMIVLVTGATGMLWAQDNGTMIPLVGEQFEGFWGIAFSKDGSKVVTTGHLRIRIWDAATGKLIRTFDTVSYNGFSSAEFSPDGSKIVVTGYEGEQPGYPVQIFDATTGAQIHSMEGHEYGSRIAHYFDDGKKIISSAAEDDISLRIWDAETGQQTGMTVVPGFTRGYALSPDEKRIAAIRDYWSDELSKLRYAIRIIDLATGDSINEFTFDSVVTGLSWTNNNDELAVCLFEKTGPFAGRIAPSRIMNVNTGEVIAEYNFPDVYAGIVTVSSTDLIAVSGGSYVFNSQDIPFQLDIWHKTSTRPILTYKTLSQVVKTAFSPNGKQVAFTRGDGDTAYIWNLPAISDAPVAGNIDHGMAISCTPNPASSELVISYQMSSPSVIRMSLVDAIGRTVSVLVDKAVEAGVHRLPLKADDLQPGIYYCYAQKDGQVSVCPIHVVR